MLAECPAFVLHSYRIDQPEPFLPRRGGRALRYRHGVNLSLAHLSPMSAPGIQIADPARAFIDHLPTIDRVIAIIARRNGLTSADADEFGSWTRARIIDSDYAILRKFAGRSTLTTYLTVVLGNLFHDYRNSVWGRWRPSAAAIRAGSIGIRLEELLYRDGFSLRESIEVLRSGGVELSDLEIGRMAHILPARQPASEVLDGTSGEAADHRAVLALDDDFTLLRAALAELPAEEQTIMRLRFWDDISVADIARRLGLDQKPLYRRIETIELRLRTVLGERGFDQERARDLLRSGAAW